MYRCLRCQSEYDEPTRLCAGCWSMDTVMAVPRRRPAEIDRGIEVSTARDLVKRAWDTVDVEAACPGLRIQPGALLVVTGPPGAGKSTLALALADTSRRPVVVFAAEERLGASISERLSRLGIHRADMHIVGRATVDELVGLCRRVRAGVLVVDSVQATTLLPHDLRSAVNALSLDLLIAVSQVTKSGDMRGTRELEHEADVILSLDESGWMVTKSRYSRTGVTGEVRYGCDRQ